MKDASLFVNWVRLYARIMKLEVESFDHETGKPSGETVFLDVTIEIDHDADDHSRLRLRCDHGNLVLRPTGGVNSIEIEIDYQGKLER